MSPNNNVALRLSWDMDLEFRLDRTLDKYFRIPEYLKFKSVVKHNTYLYTRINT